MKPKISFNAEQFNFLQLLCGQLLAQLFFSGLLVALNNSTESPCGDSNLISLKGTITSPNYPSPYPSHIECEWKIHSPVKSILKIKITDLDIEEDDPCLKSPCCSHQWLLVPSEGGRGSKHLCGTNATENTIIISQQITVIRFYSTNNRNVRRGFELTYSIDLSPCKVHQFQCTSGRCVSNNSLCNGVDDCGDGSDEMHCPRITQTSLKYGFFPRKILDINNHLEPEKICNDGRVPCSLSPDHCYSLHTDLCDGEFDCPKGEDEIGCVPECPEQISCSSGDGCYYPSQRCNLKRNCRDNSDETGCPAGPCIALQFTCLNGACVSGSAICDGDDDCGDLSDEENCTKSSFMTAAVMGLLSCVFLFCIGLSCLYRVYTARLRVSAGFAHQLEPESVDEEFMYREPPPAYSVAVGNIGIISYPAPKLMERYFAPVQTPRPHQIQNRRRRSNGTCDSLTATSWSRTSTPYTNYNSLPTVQSGRKKSEPGENQSNIEGIIELFAFPEEVSSCQLGPQSNCMQSRVHNESPSSSPSLSPSRESVTSSTSLEDHEDLIRSCQS